MMEQTTLAVIDHLLTTTRSVRKRLDLSRPVPRQVLVECLALAVQAPTGSNAQGWRFLVVTDPEKRRTIGRYYRDSFMDYARSRASAPGSLATGPQSDPAQMRRVVSSAMYLAQHMGEVPALVIFCIQGRPPDPAPMIQAGLYGSVLPAAWSFMLALRSRGLGTAWTTLHLRYEREIAALLGVPDHITQAVLFPVAYYHGDDFRPARRIPAAELTYWDEWGVDA